MFNYFIRCGYLSGSRTGFLKDSVSGEFGVKQRKVSDVTGDPKRNRTRVAGLVSDTDDHCATAANRQEGYFF